MPPNAQPFERNFTPSDATVFRELIADLIGQQCRRIDRLYGGAFSLHFGDWLPSSSAKGRDRGSWVITAWGCDARIETRGGEIVDDRIVEREEVVARARDLEGTALEQIELDPGTITLRLRFIGGAVLDLFLDPAYNGDAWTISVPSRQTIAVTVGRRWSLEEDRRTV